MLLLREIAVAPPVVQVETRGLEEAMVDEAATPVWWATSVPLEGGLVAEVALNPAWLEAMRRSLAIKRF
ncbi:MAG: hypothetical protein JWO26_2429 [Rhodospirillales bacterium]|jgi:hypothetical protein|nr:hypothetical protein [Rhodospirillales bacterium]MDB5382797.1 hypothetical protein [Rhodospirillales bacterium]